MANVSFVCGRFVAICNINSDGSGSTVFRCPPGLNFEDHASFGERYELDSKVAGYQIANGIPFVRPMALWGQSAPSPSTPNF